MTTSPSRLEQSVQSGLINVDDELIKGIEALTSKDADFWTFRVGGRSYYDRAPYQYPAMMVPALQRELAKLLFRLQPNLRTVADPFVGSGTVLCEAMLAGKQFIGQDINPLAVLISKMRHACLDIERIDESLTKCLKWIEADSSDAYEANFFNQSKWLNKGVNIGLSRIKRSIEKESNKNVRIFFWVALAETIRLNSNSRTSTYKLHIRPADECNANMGDVMEAFNRICRSNLAIINELRLRLDADGFLKGSHYEPSVNIALGDSTAALPGLSNNTSASFEMVMSSPPYGDNKTTVPYGQAAWLPLQWILAKDLGDETLIRNSLTSTYKIDTDSLGGHASKRNLAKNIAELRMLSPSFGRTIDALKDLPDDGAKRLTSFVYDLRKVLNNTANRCVRNSYMVWTLGNRRIRTVECPLTDIISELLAHKCAKEVYRVQRSIPSKRMANRNNIAPTMRSETILILRKTE